MNIDTKKIIRIILDKKNIPLFILFFCAVAVLMAMEFYPQSEPSKKETTSGDNTFDYCVYMEQKATKILQDIDGVGRIEVALTLESGPQMRYVTEEKVSGNSYESAFSENGREETQKESSILVVRDGSGGETPVLLEELQPKIMGVVVVCDGADDESVCLDITSALKALFDISSGKIHIAKMID